jgi:hypothetical protein
MWQITWILSLLPDWFWHITLIGSVLAILASWILKVIPFVRTYSLPIRVIGVLVLLLSVWVEGAMSNEEKWQNEIKDLKAKLEVAENRSKEENIKIEEKIVTKTKVIKQKGDDIIKYIDREIVKNNEIIKYVENCPLPKEVIEIHNSAATMNRDKK